MSPIELATREIEMEMRSLTMAGTV
jgi:hypothetical protein